MTSLLPPSLMPHRRALIAGLAIWAYCAFILYAMQRPAMCACGSV